MGKLFVKSCIVLSLALFSCSENSPQGSGLEIQKEDSIKKEPVAKKAEEATNSKFLDVSYFTEKFDYFKKNNHEENNTDLVGELDFLDQTVKVFSYNRKIENVDIDSLHIALHIRSFHPSDSIYYAEGCSPKHTKFKNYNIKNYGAVKIYYFEYQSKPACKIDNPIVIINSLRQELIIIDADHVDVKESKGFIDIVYNVRGNLSKYSLVAKNGVFLYKS